MAEIMIEILLQRRALFLRSHVSETSERKQHESSGQKSAALIHTNVHTNSRHAKQQRLVVYCLKQCGTV